MKKFVNVSFAYAIAALVAGVFYREFTKYIGFTGETTLSVLHVHLLTLGMFFFLILVPISILSDVESQKTFKPFFILYNIGVPLTVIMLTVRGLVQTGTITASRALDASISGTAGIGHILVGTGLILFFIALRNARFKQYTS